jgi:hypothetical protein
MKKATKKEIKELAIEMENKYSDLVWFARKSKDDYASNDEVRDKMREIMKKYPETNDLIKDEYNWTHGFNSGCLAAFRLILGSMEYNTEEAKEEFPFLDS